MTHAEIFSRMREAQEKYRADMIALEEQYQRDKIELMTRKPFAELQVECGLIGHLFGPGRQHCSDPLGDVDLCVICGAKEL